MRDDRIGMAGCIDELYQKARSFEQKCEEMKQRIEECQEIINKLQRKRGG